MKKNYTIGLCIVLLCLPAIKILAQINGIVTINSGLPTGGTNYQTWNALASVLNGPGINGALTVNIQAGTSYTEQVIFNQVIGASATNSIVINGNGTSITFTATSTTNGHTIRLNGADFVTMNDLVVLGLGATAGWPLTLTNQASNNSFNNCTFSVQINQTSANWIPVMCSGNPTSPTAAGDFGSNNTWTGCVMSGGNAGVSFVGSTAAPFSANNRVINCTIQDFQANGIQSTNHQNALFSGNTIQRLTRTTSGTCIGIVLNAGNLRAVVEGNRIRRLFDNMLTNTSTSYGINCTSAPGSGNEILVRNNIISDIRHNGELRGIFSSVANIVIYHNTISIDDPNSTSGSGTFGIITAATTTVMNNIVTISRGGNGTKFCLNFSSLPVVSNFNVLFISSVAGSNNIGFATSNFSTFTSWKNANNNAFDQNSLNVDPMFTSLGSNYTPLNVAINNGGTAMGLTTDISGTARSLSTPDPGAIEIFNVPCSGPPAVTTVITPTNIFCSYTSTMAILPVSTYSFSGFSYQWQSSTVTPLGPFTVIPGATLATLPTSSLVNVTTWYSVLVACPGQGTTTSVSGLISMVPTVTNTVPYFESFETLEPQRLLPNCSWAVTNSLSALSQATTGTQGRVPRTGTKFAMFQNASPGVPGTNAFYTNGIWMNAGVTYSASVWYRNDGTNINWTDMSILVGPNQSPTSQFTVVSSNGPVVASIHQALAGTFTVPSSGIYYVAIRATSTSGGAPYLAFDDIRIELPCALNTPSVSTSVISNTVCSDHAVTLFGTGADSYTWSTGENAAVITVTPQGANNVVSYTLSGTKTISGCVASVVQTLNVYPSPAVSAVVFPTEGCAGSTVNLQASSHTALSFNWSNGLNGPSAIVNLPNTGGATVTYSVYGINLFGCDALATVSVKVNQLPNITVGANPTQICEGENVTLTAAGAQTYNWVSNTSIMYLGNPIILSPATSAVFTVTGTDAKSCSNKAMYTLVVDPCTGFKSISANSGLKVSPNPNNGAFTIQTSTSAEKIIELLDMTGRIVLSSRISNEKADINMNGFAQGIYYLKVQSGFSTEVIKIVKSN